MKLSLRRTLVRPAFQLGIKIHHRGFYFFPKYRSALSFEKKIIKNLLPCSGNAACAEQSGKRDLLLFTFFGQTKEATKTLTKVITKEIF